MTPDMTLDMTRTATESGVLLGLPHGDAWRSLLKVLPLGPGDRVLTTSSTDLDPGLGGLTHLLWWDPSIAAVVVPRDEAEGGTPTDLDDVRRAIELTGSEALLLVDAGSRGGLDGLERDAHVADLVAASAGGRRPHQEPASLLAWSPRLTPALSVLDCLHPLSYDVLARVGRGGCE
jgi:hypothetical protein